MHTRFGRALRGLWDLADEGAFLNHGSFGACPKVVLAAQARVRAAMESQPDVFFRRQVMPSEDGGETPLRAAAARLAAFVNVPAAQIAFVENATLGVQAALDSVTLAAGDEVLITSHTYNAVRLLVEARCAASGAKARVVRIPIPASADDIVARFEAEAAPSVKLAIVDHITSPTALVMPLARIVPLLRRVGARVLVDGAHGLGHVPLDLAAIGADWYVSNAHKWLYAPRGCAMLWASAEMAATTRPVVSATTSSAASLRRSTGWGRATIPPGWPLRRRSTSMPGSIPARCNCTTGGSSRRPPRGSPPWAQFP
jgi:isopenicillin-N epimerase